MGELCNQCPRKCNVDRSRALGFCGVPEGFRVARVALHAWEEPVISGERGSGTVFFCGCNLRCVFCQNREVSRATLGRELSAEELAAKLLRLQEQGAHNLNLVTPTPYARQLIPLLKALKPRLSIPVVYNCGGYEDVETLRALEGLVDVWLPDFKYFDADLAKRYSAAPDYFPVALDALREMLRQCPTRAFAKDGTLARGVIVRHLVLPSHRADSIALLEALAREFGSDAFLLSLMSQYTPTFAKDAPDPALHRRLTSFEYEKVLDTATRLGFDGFRQSRSSAPELYSPDFSKME